MDVVLFDDIHYITDENTDSEMDTIKLLSHVESCEFSDDVCHDFLTFWEAMNYFTELYTCS